MGENRMCQDLWQHWIELKIFLSTWFDDLLVWYEIKSIYNSNPELQLFLLGIKNENWLKHRWTDKEKINKSTSFNTQ